MVFSIIARVAREHPFKFGVLFSGAKTSFSDWLVQSQIEKRERIDWRRNATFASFGFFYLGGVQYAIYVPLFSRLFPGAAAFAKAPISAKLADPAGMRNMLVQVGLDQFVHHPLMYFPVFYCLKDVVNGGSIQGGLSKYSVNYQEDLVALWKIWVPSTIINFSLMPMHLRIPWVASTSLIWTCIISMMRGASDVETDPEKAMNATGAQGTPLSQLYDLGISAKPAYLYDKSKAHLMVTASGRDRVGFLSDVTSAVNKHGGNVLDVKAYKVGREFVTIMLLESDKSVADQLKRDMRAETRGMEVAVMNTQPWLSEEDSPRCKDGVHYTGHLRAQGRDKKGLLDKITRLLAEEDLDINSLECKQHVQRTTAKDGSSEDQQFFMISGVVRSFSQVDRKRLEQRLAAFEKAEEMRIGIQETDPDPSFSAFASTESPSSTAKRLVRTVTGAYPASGKSS